MKTALPSSLLLEIQCLETPWPSAGSTQTNALIVWSVRQSTVVSSWPRHRRQKDLRQKCCRVSILHEGTR